MERLMGEKNRSERYDRAEAQRRFEAALRGARIAGPKHNESLTPKKNKQRAARGRAQKK
jgi:hypothetical protein